MQPWVIAVIAVVVLVVLVVVVMLAMRGKGEGTVESAAKPPQPSPVPPAAVSPALMTPAVTSPEPVTAPRPESKPVAQTRPATLQVEALAPSMTDEAPMLGAEDGEIKMGTDELPKFATSEMPALPESGGTYRTPAAQKLSAAISSGNCPKCNAPTFVGAETSQGDNMFKLEARCGACGHKANLIDMRV